MKSQLFGIIATLSLLAGCANLPSQNAWNTLTGQDNRTWGYVQTQAAEQAKAIFSQPFSSKGGGRTYSRDQIQFDKVLLPPNSLSTLKLRTYCMDKSIPAPKSNEKLHLVPVGKLIDRDISSIYKSLMKYSHNHPEKYTQIQRIVWNFTSIYDDEKKSSSMHNEDYALLDTIYPNASQIVRSYFNKKNLAGKATEFFSNKLGEVLNQQGLGTSVLNQQGLMSTALHSISQSNSQVDSILRSLESMPVSGLIPNDNSDYSLLTNGVAVKATHRGGARNSELTIRNTNDHPVAFQPTDYALESKRKTQRLGVGGVDNIQQENEEPIDPVRYYITFIAREGFPGHAFIQWVKTDDNAKFTEAKAFGFYPMENAELCRGWDAGCLGFGKNVPGELRNEYLQHDGINGDFVLRVRVNATDYMKTLSIRDEWTRRFATETVPANQYDLYQRNCVVFTDTIAKNIGGKAYTPINPIDQAVHQERSWDYPLETPQDVTFTRPWKYMRNLRDKNLDRHTSIGQLYPANLSR